MIESEVIHMSIGQRISERRRSFGYSQEYIAEQLTVSRQAVSKWEQDLSAPDTYNLIALAELLDVSVEYLSTGKQRPEPSEATPQPTTPPHKEGLGTARIAGLILLGAGLTSLILGLLLSRALIVLSVLLLLYGILMLAVRRYLGLVLLWVTATIVFFVTVMLMPLRKVSVNPNGATAVAIRVSPSSVGLLALSCAAVGTAICIVLHRLWQRKQRNRNSK
jgi:transcriptional regulator with XRE-family HTH domain